MVNAITKAGQDGAIIARDSFGSTELEQRHETAATAVAAQARAEIEAAYVMALQRPRNWDDVRTKLLAECSRTSFAERAYFAVPRGDKPGRITGHMNPSSNGPSGLIEGLSIRFVEAALRCAGNVICPSRTIYDDDTKRIVRVIVTDLEANLHYPKDIVIEKTVERKKPKDRDKVLGSRTNSVGDVVYLVACTDDELLLKENNLTSKAIRTNGMRIFPADILEESEQRISETVKAGVEKDPTAARKKIADGFATLGVLPSNLAEYLGHDLAGCTPAEVQMLGGLFRALRDGEITWPEVMGSVVKSGDAPEQREEKKTAAGKVADKIKARMTPPKAADPTPAHDPKTGEILPSTGTTAATPKPATSETPAAEPPIGPACIVCGLPVPGDKAAWVDARNAWRHQGCEYIYKVPEATATPPEASGKHSRRPEDELLPEPPMGALADDPKPT